MMVDQNINSKIQELKTKIQLLENKVAIQWERKVENLRDKKLVISYKNGIIDSDGDEK